MKNDNHIRLALLLLCMVPHLCLAQNDFGRRAVEAANRFNARYPQEKVYLHLDNTAYYLNEILWWKAYLFRTDNDSLGSLSRVLYVELVDPSGEVVETEKSLVEDGQTNGQFLLSRYTRSGFYQVRAYTRYMLNWGEDLVFSRVIPVFKRPTVDGDYSERKILEQPSFPAAASSNGGMGDASLGDSTHYLVRFFPEGGGLVNGVKSNVAFEVTDGRGKPVHATGWLEGNGGEDGPVSTLRDGRGVFSLVPSKTVARLRLTMPNGKTETFDLPVAAASGYAMTVDATGKDRITWSVGMSADLQGQQTETLLIHNGKARLVSSPLLRKDMPDGCSQLTLINHEGDILCSRMVFNYPRGMSDNVHVSIADSTIWPDKEMTLDIRAERQASVSLAVCDAETQLAAENHNAATWYLLSSDLKGYIHNPEYYLEADDEERRRAADLLMLVQGWRKYDVERVLGNTQWKKTFPVEQGLLIDGQLKAYNKRSKVAGANLKIDLFSSLGSRLSGDVTTDSTGFYVFTVPDCAGNWDMSMHTTLNDKDRRYYITVNRNFSPKVGTPSWQSMNDDARQIIPDFHFTLDKAYVDSIPMDLRAHWLDHVDVNAKRIWKNPREFWERESSGAKYASIRYDMAKAGDMLADEGKEAPTLVEWLKAKNPLVEGFDNITGEYRASSAYHSLYGDGLSYGGRGIMWIVNNWFVCGTSLTGRAPKNGSNDRPLAATNYHIPYDISEVKSVYISTASDDWKRFIAAPQFEGRDYVTIFVYTKPEVPMPKGYRHTTFQAYNIKEDYQQMMQLTGADIDGSDYRRTLCWNPNVELDHDGKASVKFKNNSTTRHLTVSVAGFTRDGKPLFKKN